MDTTGISQSLGLFGTGVVFVGAVITGVGLFIGWRRADSRRAQVLRDEFGQRNTALANAVRVKLSAIVTSLPGPDVRPNAPIVQSQLIEVIGGLQGAIATAMTSAATDEGVKATAHGMLAEHEHRETAISLHDLQWALAGIAIQAFGAMVTGLGIIVGM